MNPTLTNATVTLHVTGQLTMDCESLIALVQAQASERSLASPPPSAQLSPMPIEPRPPARLAYSVRETAELLGVSYMTVHRLLKRGLLQSSNALRHKLIPKTEVERFLRDTLSLDF